MKRFLTHGLVFAVVAMFGTCLNAQEVITSYSTVSDDGTVNNQAGPMFGQSITVNVGADTADASIPATVFLNEVSFQYSSSASGGNPANVFLHVYDDFASDGTNAPTTIGSLLAVSTNALDMSALVGSEQLTWSFGGDAIDKSASLAYIFSTDTVAATVGNSTNLADAMIGAELDTGNPYSGGQAFRGNGTESDWDMAFEVKTSTVAVPEPTSLMLMGMGVIGFVSSRRRRS